MNTEKKRDRERENVDYPSSDVDVSSLQRHSRETRRVANPRKLERGSMKAEDALGSGSTTSWSGEFMFIRSTRPAAKRYQHLS